MFLEAATSQNFSSHERPLFEKESVCVCDSGAMAPLPERGAFTFRMEGEEKGSDHFSRLAHWPGTACSGVTVGRGYDLGQHAPHRIRRDLERSGLSRRDAMKFAGASGLKGDKARMWLEKNGFKLPMLTSIQQKKLFEILYFAMIDDILRISRKEAVVSRYGKLRWKNLHPALKEMVIDLRYRGDYDGETRKVVQLHLVNNDLDGFFKALSDESFWRRGRPVETPFGTARRKPRQAVPERRFRERISFLEEFVPLPCCTFL